MRPAYAFAPVLAAAAVLVLAGCGGGPAPSPSPSDTASASPSPTPSESAPAPEPVARGASTPFDAWDAYLACRNLSAPFFTGPGGAWDFGAIDYAPKASSDVIARTDGLFYVYIEVVNGNGDTDATRNVAAECVVGGTLGAPRYEMFGALVRSPLSERNPDAALPTG
jgi:hypothetical protein